MKRIDIESLLQWAYARELPKAQMNAGCPSGFGGAWDGVSQFGNLLAKVDGPAPVNGYGAVIDFTAFDGPHADAVAVGDAVARLDGLELGVPDDWSPLADLGDLGDLGKQCVARALSRLYAVDGKGGRRLRLSARGLIERNAKLGSRPVWEADMPRVDFVRDSVSGRPLWFVKAGRWREGAFGDVFEEIETPVRIDDRTRRPPAGAYQKRRLDPDPLDAVIARAEWELWRAALDMLADELDGLLVDHVAIRSALPARPWETGGVEIKRKIISDLSQGAETLGVPVAGKPRKRAKTAIGN